MIKQEHGSVIKLENAAPQFKDKEGSVFIYDVNVGVWFLKEQYDKLDMDDDDTDIGGVPYLSHDQLRHFGEWKLCGA